MEGQSIAFRGQYGKTRTDILSRVGSEPTFRVLRWSNAVRAVSANTALQSNCFISKSSPLGTIESM
jgi:hypothetical protein